MNGSNLMDLVPREEIKDITSELSETVIDSFMEDGVLKDIPLFNTIFGLYKVGVKIRETYFLKKLLIFLQYTSTIDLVKRQEFWNDIEEDSKTKSELGDKIIQLLDRVDETKKAVWISLSFKELLLGNLAKNDFYDLIYSIDKLKAHLAVSYYEYNTGYFDQRSDYLSHFTSVGLLYNESLYKNNISVKTSKVRVKKPISAEMFCRIIWFTDQKEIVDRHRARIDKKLSKKTNEDERITKGSDTIKKPISEFLSDLDKMTNIEIMRVKPTTSYFILDEEIAVVIEEEFAYYFKYKSWHNSGMKL